MYSSSLYGSSSSLSSLSSSSASSMSTVVFVFMIIGLVLGLVAAIYGLAVFLREKNAGKYTGKLAQLRKFLNFDQLLIEYICKFCYMFLAVFITVFAFGLLFSGQVFSFFGFVIGGNIAVRVMFESTMMIIGLHRNTREIRDYHLGKKSEKKEEKK